MGFLILIIGLVSFYSFFRFLIELGKQSIDECKLHSWHYNSENKMQCLNCKQYPRQ